MIHVLAMVTAKPGQRDTVLAAFRANRANVHAEHGCLEYDAATDTPDAGPIQTPLGPDSFVVIEKWENLAALEAHGTSAHMKAYGIHTRDLIATRAIHVLSSG